MDFLVARDDLHRIRFEDAGVPEPAEGRALLAVDAFGLSANNITYAMSASGSTLLQSLTDPTGPSGRLKGTPRSRSGSA